MGPKWRALIAFLYFVLFPDLFQIPVQPFAKLVAGPDAMMSDDLIFLTPCCWFVEHVLIIVSVLFLASNQGAPRSSR
jgi:hypothetical protein